jgi:biopolymer transport protein ExbD
MSVRLDYAGDALDAIHEINVTPFIDVMLVLLIIFMIAAPPRTVDVSVDLPTSNVERQPRPDQPIFLAVKSDLTLALGDASIPRSELQSALDALSKADRTQRVFLRADKSVAYGNPIDTINALRSAGYLKVALVALEATDERHCYAGRSCAL